MRPNVVQKIVLMLFPNLRMKYSNRCKQPTKIIERSSLLHRHCLIHPPISICKVVKTTANLRANLLKQYKVHCFFPLLL